MQRKKREEKRAAKKGREQLIEKVCFYLLFAALGALFGSAELLFGVRPFGVALAAGVSELFPAAALGTAVFATVTGDYLSVVAVGIVALFRLGCSFFPQVTGEKGGGIFSQRVSFRTLGAALATFITATVALFRGEFRYYDLLALLLGTAVSALCAFLIARMFSPHERSPFTYSREIGVAVLALIGIFALRTVSLAGIYPAVVCGTLAAFWVAAHYGPLFGGAWGLLAGLCFDIRMAPTILLCGVGFGLLQKSSRGGGILAGCGTAAVYAFLAVGSAGITRMLPSLLTAGAFFLAGDSAGLVEGSPIRRLATQRRRNGVQAVKELEAAHNAARLRGISDAFSELSGILYELGGRQRRPGQLDLRHLCDREFDKVCPACPKREICWGSEYTATAENVAALGARLYQAGRAGKEQLSPDLVARCGALPQILQRINGGAQRMFEEAMRGDKTSVVATDYAAMGRLLSDTLEFGERNFRPNEEQSERIFARLQRMGYTAESVSVCGERRRQILLRALKLPGRRIKQRELRATLEQICNFTLGEAEITEREGVCDYLFRESIAYQAFTVKQSRAKGGKEGGYCGDSSAVFGDDAGTYYVLLCDGMGSGNRAAVTSALSSTVLSRLLRAGNRPETALRMLNGVLSARGQRENESSSTVDLLEVNCVSGAATLYKCGAAPTYLLRRGQITRFFSRTAPVGILEALDAEKLSFEVEAGDVLVQISDGVSGGEEECPFLADMLMTKWDGDAERFARLLLNRADEEGRDDLSVLITGIEKSPVPHTQDIPRAG